MNKKAVLTATLLFLLYSLTAQEEKRKTENVFLITLDGLRWQEMFAGAVDSMMNDLTFVQDSTFLQKQFAAPTAEEQREKLLPFFWETIAKEGQIYGNRWEGNKVNCSNIFWFSYPGYNEILTGYSDPRIKSNAKLPNPNMTVLEWVNQQPGFEDRVAAFGSWDVFPYIINEERSGVPVNAGFELVEGDDLTQKEKFLNELQPQLPEPWHTVRHDAFTHGYALEHLKKYHPRLLYISYGETDDFAHDGKYDHYLMSARQTSNWIKELWEFVQNDPVYKNKTTFLITTDHGRGDSPKAEWKSHGKIYKGSDAIWMAVIGPDTPALGEVKTDQQLWQRQIAKTAAALLGLDYENKYEQVGNVIKKMMK